MQCVPFGFKWQIFAKLAPMEEWMTGLENNPAWAGRLLHVWLGRLMTHH